MFKPEYLLAAIASGLLSQFCPKQEAPKSTYEVQAAEFFESGQFSDNCSVNSVLKERSTAEFTNIIKKLTDSGCTTVAIAESDGDVGLASRHVLNGGEVKYFWAWAHPDYLPVQAEVFPDNGTIQIIAVGEGPPPLEDLSGQLQAVLLD